MQSASTRPVVPGQARDSRMAKLWVAEPIDQTSIHDQTHANPRTNREISEISEPAGRAPAPFGEGCTVHVRIEPRGHVEGAR